MVLLVPALDPQKYLGGLFCSGLGHLDGLEAALQGRVSLHVLTVIVKGGGADTLKLTPCQGGLEDIGGVNRAFGCPGTHDGVHLVYEEDTVA